MKLSTGGKKPKTETGSPNATTNANSPSPVVEKPQAAAINFDEYIQDYYQSLMLVSESQSMSRRRSKISSSPRNGDTSPGGNRMKNLPVFKMEEMLPPDYYTS